MKYFNLVMLFQILVDFFEGYFLQQLYGDFFDRRIGEKIWNGFAVVAFYVAFQYAKKFVLPADYRVVHITENLLLNLALTFLGLLFLLVCFYKQIGMVSVFLIVSFMAIQEISRIITLIVPYLADSLTGILNQYGEDKFLVTMFITDGIWMLAYLIRILILYGSLKNIRENFREKQCCMHSPELQFLLIPGLTSLSITVFLNLIMFRTGRGGQVEFLFDIYPVLRLFMPVILSLSLLSILYGVKLFQDMILLNRERSSRTVLENQIKSMKEYMEESQRIQSGIRGMKHDMKNTLAVIGELAFKMPENENAELHQYLSELNQTMGSLEYLFKTGNGVVDALLNMKYYEAILEIPDLDMDAEDLLFPETLKIQSYDMGIIMGNALDNAVDACKRLKSASACPAALARSMERKEEKVYIKLSSFQRRNMFFVEVENSFDGKLFWKGRTEFPVSDKEDGEHHGLGLINIKKAAEKYDGAVEWEVRDRTFVLSVMLKNEMEKGRDGL